MNSRLIDFLKKRGVLEQYTTNCIGAGKEVIKSDIWSAFLWATSPEGHHFWGDLAIDFDEFRDEVD